MDTGLERKTTRQDSDDVDWRKSKHSDVIVSAYADEENELLKAIDTYRRVNGVGHVANTEVMWILYQLGWRKVEPSKVRFP